MTETKDKLPNIDRKDVIYETICGDCYTFISKKPELATIKLKGSRSIKYINFINKLYKLEI